MAEKKTEGNRKKGKRPTSPGPRAKLTFPQPRPASPVCLIPRRGKQLAGAHADAGDHLPGCLEPCQASKSRHRDNHVAPFTFPLLWPLSRPPVLDFDDDHNSPESTDV